MESKKKKLIDSISSCDLSVSSKYSIRLMEELVLDKVSCNSDEFNVIGDSVLSSFDYEQSDDNILFSLIVNLHVRGLIDNDNNYIDLLEHCINNDNIEIIHYIFDQVFNGDIEDLINSNKGKLISCTIDNGNSDLLEYILNKCPCTANLYLNANKGIANDNNGVSLLSYILYNASKNKATSSYFDNKQLDITKKMIDFVLEKDKDIFNKSFGIKGEPLYLIPFLTRSNFTIDKIFNLLEFINGRFSVNKFDHFEGLDVYDLSCLFIAYYDNPIDLNHYIKSNNLSNCKCSLRGVFDIDMKKVKQNNMDYIINNLCSSKRLEDVNFIVVDKENQFLKEIGRASPKKNNPFKI